MRIGIQNNGIYFIYTEVQLYKSGDFKLVQIDRNPPSRPFIGKCISTVNLWYSSI